MNKYDSNAFVQAFSKKVNKQLACPICGGEKFMTNGNYYASIITGEDLDAIGLENSISAGMLICQNCGHIELFALGVLGLE